LPGHNAKKQHKVAQGVDHPSRQSRTMRFLRGTKRAAGFAAKHPILTLSAITVLLLPSITKGQGKETAEKPKVTDERKTDISTNHGVPIPNTSKVLVGTKIVTFDLSRIGISVFSGKETTTRVPTPGVGAMHYVAGDGWKGILVFLEPALQDTAAKGGFYQSVNGWILNPKSAAADKTGTFAIATENGGVIIFFRGKKVNELCLKNETGIPLVIKRIDVVPSEKDDKSFILVYSENSPLTKIDAESGKITTEPIKQRAASDTSLVRPDESDSSSLMIPVLRTQPSLPDTTHR
jgi:hypothetical protein